MQKLRMHNFCQVTLQYGVFTFLSVKSKSWVRVKFLKFLPNLSF